LNYLNFLQKRLQRFWQLHQQSSIKKGRGVTFFSQPLTGLRIQVKGRLNGQDRKQKFSFSVGRLNLQELNTGIDFHQTEAFGLSGVLGISVWLSFET
jgi:hypothetical protein